MSKFKKGDLLMAIASSLEVSITKEKVYEVLDVDSFDIKHSCVTIEDDNGSQHSVREFRFKKVEKDDDLDLKELLKKANEGRKALIELYKLAPDRLTGGSMGMRTSPFRNEPTDVTYSLLKKSTAPPFEFSKWLATPKANGILEIGCRRFLVSSLRTALKKVLSEGNSSVVVRGEIMSGNIRFDVTRTGVMDRVPGREKGIGSILLTWKELEFLHSKLKDLE